MKKMNTVLSYVLGVCLMALIVACANEDWGNLFSLDIHTEHADFTGYSTGKVLNGSTTLAEVRIDLGQTQIQVEPDQLGKVEKVNETVPEFADLSIADLFKKKGTKNFSFSDSQTAVAVWSYLREISEVYKLDITDIQYTGYDPEITVPGERARIVLHFKVVYSVEGNKEVLEPLILSPSYYQYVKETPIDDMAIVTTHDEIGGSTGDVTAKDAAFTADVWLKLAQTSITVSKEQFGKVNLSQAGTPQSTAINKNDSIGEQITFADNFVDTQRASVTIRNAHAKDAKFYYSITSLQYIDYTSTPVSDKKNLITLHYRGQFLHSDGSKQGSFDLYPAYYQVLEDEKPAELTYKVDSVYTTLSDGSMLWRATITRSDGKKWDQRKTVAFVGDVHGRYVFGVSEAKVVNKNDTHKKHPEKCTTEQENEWTITTDYETWRWERFFANPQNKELTAETEIVYWTKQLTFKDPETGWTLTTKPLVKNCEIVADEIYTDSSAPSKKDDQDHDYNYVGSHRLTVKNTLDGNTFHSSTATCHLYKW